MENAQIAALLDEIADLLELTQGDAFRIRSYRNAARSVADSSEGIEDIVAAGRKIEDLPNIGKSTAAKIAEMLKTGTCERLEELRREVPHEVTLLMRVPHLGPKKAMELYRSLKIKTYEDLEKACNEGKVRDLPRMSEKTEQQILEGLKMLRATTGRLLYKNVAEIVQTLEKHLGKLASIKRWQVAGSFRRRKETIGDLDILIEAPDRDKACDDILTNKAIGKVVDRGPERLTVVLNSGLQVDFRFFEAGSFGAALMYFTGSKAHNIALRKRSIKMGYKLNEYGLMRASPKDKAAAEKESPKPARTTRKRPVEEPAATAQPEEQVAGASEEDVYAKLKLPYIEPELREDHGEIDAAAEGKLPKLVELADIRGDLHMHTKATDGKNTIEELAQAAAERGYKYVAVTDHSQAVRMAFGFDDDKAISQADKIRLAGQKLKGLRLLAGIEVDILKDGKLDLADKTLSQLDWVVASVHYHMDMPEQAMTDRLLAAVKSGVVHCLGHPMCRLIGRRDPIRFDVDKVLQACADNHVAVEINSQPDRLDLPDAYCKRAAEMGVKFVISTDAHRITEFDFMTYGLNVARRGWLSRENVLNTLDAGEFLARIERS